MIYYYGKLRVHICVSFVSVACIPWWFTTINPPLCVGNKFRCLVYYNGPPDASIGHAQNLGGQAPYGVRVRLCFCLSSFFELACRPNGLIFKCVVKTWELMATGARPTHREPLWNTTTCYDPPRWYTVESDWTNITWPISVISDHANATIETPWCVSGCIPTVQGYCSRFQIQSSVEAANRKLLFRAVPHVSDVFPGWIPTVWDWPGQLQSVSRMRQQTGSSYAMRYCKSETWFVDRFRLPQTCTMWFSQKAAMSDNTDLR